MSSEPQAAWHRPSGVDELADVVTGAGERPLLPTGASTAGRGPESRVAGEGVEVVSTADLRGIVEHRPRDSTLTVEAGTRVADLMDAVAEEGSWLPLGGTALSRSVGGLVAAAPAGPYDQQYGPVRRQLLACSLVTHGGTRVRWGRAVMKNVAGFDLPRLVAGSFDRLGVLHRLSLRVWPAPRARRRYRIVGDDPSLEMAGRMTEADVAFRPDAVVWRRRPPSGGRGESDEQLEVELLGSAASVEAREERMEGWTAEVGARSARLDDPTEDAGSANRTTEVSVLALTGPRTDYADWTRRCLSLLDSDLLEAEGYPGTGFLRCWCRCSEEASPPAASRLAPELPDGISLRLERADPRGHRALRERRDPELARMEERVVEALEGRPRHWLSDYL